MLKGTLESFRQQWKKEVSLQNEKIGEVTEESANKSTDDVLGKGIKEIPNQSLESDIEKRVSIIAF